MSVYLVHIKVKTGGTLCEDSKMRLKFLFIIGYSYNPKLNTFFLGSQHRGGRSGHPARRLTPKTNKHSPVCLFFLRDIRRGILTFRHFIHGGSLSYAYFNILDHDCISILYQSIDIDIFHSVMYTLGERTTFGRPLFCLKHPTAEVDSSSSSSLTRGFASTPTTTFKHAWVENLMK